MATETYTYFRADIDTNLRSEYDGAVLLTGRGTAELNAMDLFHRHLCKMIGSHNYKTSSLFTTLLGSGQYWCKVPSIFYAGMSSYLSAAQLSTVTTIQPPGTTPASDNGKIMPETGKTNYILIGDSLTRCQGSTNTQQDHPICQAINLKVGENLSFGANNLKAVSKNYCVLNIAISGSTFDGIDVYPENWDDAYKQHIKTLPVAEKMVFHIGLGSNDASHDTSISGATIWARNIALLTKLKSDFPNAKYVAQTLIKRSEANSLNDRLAAYNALLRANWQTAGYHALYDNEAAVPQLNIITGDTTNLTYYADGTHMTKAAYDLQVPVATNILNILG